MVLQASQIDSTMTFNGDLAIVVSEFNDDICSGLLEGALSSLEELGINRGRVDVHHVAGAFEIPLMAQMALKKDRISGVLALGCVIRGDTPHFDYVCQAVTDGCLQVQLKMEKPIAFGVITTDTKEQAIERSSNNSFNKGRESLIALVKSLNQLENL